MCFGLYLLDIIYRQSRSLQKPRKEVGVPRDVLEADREVVVWESIVVGANADVVDADQVLDVLDVTCEEWSILLNNCNLCSIHPLYL